jgi:HSP20 family protein
MRWDPMNEFGSISRMMDRLWENAMLTSPRLLPVESWGVSMDVLENDDNFVVKATLPGVLPDDIDVTFSNNTLTVRGEVKQDETSEDEQYHLRERRYGKFSRSITLPTRIDADKIHANYESGILTLTLPKTEEVKARRISVKSIEPGKTIEGGFEKIASKN